MLIHCIDFCSSTGFIDKPYNLSVDFGEVVLLNFVRLDYRPSLSIE